MSRVVPAYGTPFKCPTQYLYVVNTVLNFVMQRSVLTHLTHVLTPCTGCCFFKIFKF